MPYGFEAEPVLDLTLLPVHGRQVGSERWKALILRRNAPAENEVAWVARPLEYVVVVENPFRRRPVFGKNRHQPRAVAVPKRRGDWRNVAYLHGSVDLVRVTRLHTNTAGVLAIQLFEHFLHASASGH